MQVIAGFDLGTTGCRCVLFDEKLNVLGEAYHEYPLLTGEGGIVEQCAEDWWKYLILSMKESAQIAKCAESDICALSLSSQGITVVPVNQDCEALANAITWLDQRSNTGAEQLLDTIGRKKYCSITARIDPSPYGISSILWFQKHRENIAAQTWKYLMPMDYIITRLTGHAVTDHIMACGLACYDLKKRDWSDEILSAAGIRRDQLPDILDCGSVAGYVTEEVAKYTGMRVGIPVAVGTQDQKCGAIAAGLQDGIATVSMGTCAAIELPGEQMVYNASAYIPCFPGMFGRGYMLEGCINVGAGCLKWYRDLYYPDRAYTDVTELAAAHTPTLETPYFFPHLSGFGTPKRKPNGSAAFYGLRINTSREAMAYSVLESVALALNHNIEAARKTAGITLKRLRVFGGGAKSEEWLQIIADVTNLPVESLFTHEVCCVGAAILAGISIGIFASIEVAQNHAMCVGKVYTPRIDRKSILAYRRAEFESIENRIYAE